MVEGERGGRGLKRERGEEKRGAEAQLEIAAARERARSEVERAAEQLSERDRAPPRSYCCARST